MRSSIARDTMRLFGISITRASITPASPISRCSIASTLFFTPISTHRSVIFDAFSRSSGFIR